MTELNAAHQESHQLLHRRHLREQHAPTLLLVEARERTRSRMTAVRANLRNPLGLQGYAARSSVAVMARELKLQTRLELFRPGDRYTCAPQNSLDPSFPILLSSKNPHLQLQELPS